MITDNIENIKKYKFINDKVADFLLTLAANANEGHYEIDSNSYANIDIYTTRNIEDCKFEAHKKYIDIQMLLEGEEEIDIADIKNLKISEQYNEQKDVMFFENPKQSDKIILAPYKFAMIYPNEAHRPQVCLENPKTVKKVVVKISTL